jgi:hypothetical protein
MVKECPLCGETMHLREREALERIPGTQQTARRRVREWSCSQCDYYEEVDEATGGN